MPTGHNVSKLTNIHNPRKVKKSKQKNSTRQIKTTKNCERRAFWVDRTPLIWLAVRDTQLKNAAVVHNVHSLECYKSSRSSGIIKWNVICLVCVTTLWCRIAIGFINKSAHISPEMLCAHSIFGPRVINNDRNLCVSVYGVDIIGTIHAHRQQSKKEKKRSQRIECEHTTLILW